MDTTVKYKSEELIRNCFMRCKNCAFEFHEINVDEVERLLNSLEDDKPAGIDHLDCKLLKISASYISKSVCHIFNRSLISGVCPTLWKGGKIFPIPNDKK